MPSKPKAGNGKGMSKGQIEKQVAGPVPVGRQGVANPAGMTNVQGARQPPALRSDADPLPIVRKGAEKAASPAALNSAQRVSLQKTKMCKFHLLGICARGADCVFAHTDSELNPMPDFGLTRMCKTLRSTGRCSNPDCRYAHNQHELRLISYKQQREKSAWQGKMPPYTQASVPSSFRQGPEGLGMARQEQLEPYGRGGSTFQAQYSQDTAQPGANLMAPAANTCGRQVPTGYCKARPEQLESMGIGGGSFKGGSGPPPQRPAANGKGGAYWAAADERSEDLRYRQVQPNEGPTVEQLNKQVWDLAGQLGLINNREDGLGREEEPYGDYQECPEVPEALPTFASHKVASGRSTGFTPPAVASGGEAKPPGDTHLHEKVNLLNELRQLDALQQIIQDKGQGTCFPEQQAANLPRHQGVPPSSFFEEKISECSTSSSAFGNQRSLDGFPRAMPQTRSSTFDSLEPTVSTLDSLPSCSSAVRQPRVGYINTMDSLDGLDMGAMGASALRQPHVGYNNTMDSFDGLDTGASAPRQPRVGYVNTMDSFDGLDTGASALRQPRVGYVNTMDSFDGLDTGASVLRQPRVGYVNTMDSFDGLDTGASALRQPRVGYINTMDSLDGFKVGVCDHPEGSPARQPARINTLDSLASFSEFEGAGVLNERGDASAPGMQPRGLGINTLDSLASFPDEQRAMFSAYLHQHHLRTETLDSLAEMDFDSMGVHDERGDFPVGGVDGCGAGQDAQADESFKITVKNTFIEVEQPEPRARIPGHRWQVMTYDGLPQMSSLEPE